ncbi:zwei Ig domain protein zig-4-like [Homarus americanus]|uniref:zwei Ig domain protein zig-4-like n=1 Tax=Homarus americanus TaxID=6706 RepID=UPI001C44A928|nr:zwei Ig domain protein zig-4-like [Homarus americanus]
MMKIYLALPVLMALLQTVPAVPMIRNTSQNNKNSNNSNKKGSFGVKEAPPQVIWGSACSPRKAFLYQQQDALLQCEVYAPTGSVLTWYKDHTPLHHQKEAMQEEMIDSVRGGAKVHLSSVIYIDCASPDDQGRYQLDVRTPAGHLFTRYFTVQLLENVDRMLGHTCRLGKEVMSFVPRIYQFARQAVAQHGQTLVLPCRLHSHPPTMTTTWLFQNTLLSTPRQTKYQVLANGDLLVRDLSPKDRGVYTCRAHNTDLPGIADQIHTFVYPQEKDRV